LAKRLGSPDDDERGAGPAAQGAGRSGIGPFFARAGAFIRPHWRPLLLLVLSAVMATLYVIGRPYILYNDSDPLTYFRKAWWFIGHAGGMDVPSRGPGYPIWLILTGAASFDTWWLLVASQFAMAVAAPVLIYGILAPSSRNAGFAAGLLFIAFGISYMHMNWVMTEELFLFTELLSLLLISRYLCGAWAPLPAATDGSGRASWLHDRFPRFIRSPYAIALMLAYTTMVKPAAGPFFWLFILIGLLFRVEPWKRYLGPVVLYVAIMTAWGIHDYHRSPVRFSPLGMPQSQVQRNFADVYYGSSPGAVNGWTPVAANPRMAEGQQRAEEPSTAAPKPAAQPSGEGAPAVQAPTIVAERGPASQTLYRAVAALIESQRGNGQWNVTDPESAYQLYRRYGTTGELADAVFARPNPFYYQLVTVAAAQAGGDQLLGDVAREHGNGPVMAYLNYLMRHPAVPLLGPPNPYVGFMYFMKFYRYRDYLRTNAGGMRDIFLGSYNENLVTEENGPATRAYAQSIRFFVDAAPHFVFPGTTFLADFGTAEALKAYAVDNPYYSKYSGMMMGHIYQWMLLLYGEEAAGRLMGAAGLESITKNRAGFGMVFGDYLAALVYSYAEFPDLLTNFQAGFASLRANENAQLTAIVRSAKPTVLPASLAAHVGVERERGDLSKDMTTVLALCYTAFKWAKPLLFGLMIVFAVPLLLAGRGAARLVALLVPAYFISAAAFAVVMIMPHSDPRHEDVYAFFPLLIAALGFALLANAMSRRFRRSETALGPAVPAEGAAASP
jgi:hypothetical protein